MIETIALWIGYIIMFLFSLLLILGLTYVVYYSYDYWIKKLLRWENIEVRKDIIYFIKHKEEIKKYIDKLSEEEKK